MKIMLSKILKIKEVLEGIDFDGSVEISHYEAMKKPDRYVVWAEDAEGSSEEADDHKTNQSIQGTIDYYSKTDMDINVDKIQEALIGAHISFYLSSVQYEDETGYIHHEWIWEVA